MQSSAKEAIEVEQTICSVSTRLEIGFPEKASEWIESKACFSPDGESLTILGHPVMEAWEEPYMRELARIATCRKGRVLEVGFGLGISAGFVQELSPDEHVIIEANRDVYERAKLFADRSSGNVTVLHGLWQDVVGTLESESFDGILFDTYPLTSEEIHCNHFSFFAEAHRLLKKGGVLTYYSDEVEDFSETHKRALKKAGFNAFSCQVCNVSPPESCKYWRWSTIVAPIVFKDLSERY